VRPALLQLYRLGVVAAIAWLARDVAVHQRSHGDAPVEVTDNEVSAVFISGSSVYALDLTAAQANNAGSPHTPLDLGAEGAQLLDAVVNDDGDLFVLYLLGAELRMGRLPRPAARVEGETWFVATLGNGLRDTARLVLNTGEPVGAAILTDIYGVVADQAVALAGHAMLHLAGGGDLEALLDPALGLHLGHFGLLLKTHQKRPWQPFSQAVRFMRMARHSLLA
jgi:hypothetical protein